MMQTKIPNQAEGNQPHSATVYTICAAGRGRWAVLRDSSPEPVGTFEDKPAALGYAMNLARALRDSKAGLTSHPEALRRIIRGADRTRRASA